MDIHIAANAARTWVRSSLWVAGVNTPTTSPCNIQDQWSADSEVGVAWCCLHKNAEHSNYKNGIKSIEDRTNGHRCVQYRQRTLSSYCNDLKKCSDPFARNHASCLRT
jgi:hypothetical protein